MKDEEIKISKDSKFIGLIGLHDEGGIEIVEFKTKMEAETEINKCTIMHRPHHGLMRFVNVSDKKSVFFCTTCGLRHEVPGNIKTLGDLIKTFGRK